MSQSEVLLLAQQCIRVIVLTSAPVLVAGLLMGVAMSVFQILTSIQDGTLSVLPRVLAMLAVAYLALPWTLRTLVAYTLELYRQIPDFVR